MLKKLLKCIALIFIYIALNSISFSLLPFSEDFKTQNMAKGPSALPFVLISTCWIIFTMVYIINNCMTEGLKLILYTIWIIFFVNTAMTQIETLFFGEAFRGLIKEDILMICLANLIPITLTGAIAGLIFKRKNNYDKVEEHRSRIDIKKSIITVLFIGFIYVIIYFTFGYFVAWKCEMLRVFYSGFSLDSGFIEKLISNWRDNAIIYPFQYIRGILFACSGLALLNMKWKHKYDFIVSLSLVYLCTAIQLIVPNFLFPDEVRLAHFFEMFSSMLLFGIITSVLLWKCRDA